VPAPLGNQNASKGRMFADAINRALELPGRHERLKRLEAIADKLVTLAEDGDIQAIREVADRLDGKPKQAVEHAGEGGGSIGITTSGTIDHRVLPATAEFLGALLRAGADTPSAQPDADGSVLPAPVRSEADGS
jgi:hypothetical protein